MNEISGYIMCVMSYMFFCILFVFHIFEIQGKKISCKSQVLHGEEEKKMRYKQMQAAVYKKFVILQYNIINKSIFNVVFVLKKNCFYLTFFFVSQSFPRYFNKIELYPPSNLMNQW